MKNRAVVIGAVEAGLRALEIEEAAHEERGADQQFIDTATSAMTSALRARLRAPPSGTAALAQCGHDIRLRRVDGRREAEDDAGHHADEDSVDERPPISTRN